MPVLTIRPSSDVLITNWLNQSDGAASYANVDETSKNESDYNYCAAVYVNSDILYGFENRTTQSGIITKVELKAYLQNTDGVNDTKGKLCVKIGSTVYYSSEFTLGKGVYTLQTWTMTVKPSDSSAWTWADIDAFIGGCRYTDVGIGGKGVLRDCMTYAEITYTPQSRVIIF